MVSAGRDVSANALVARAAQRYFGDCGESSQPTSKTDRLGGAGIDGICARCARPLLTTEELPGSLAQSSAQQPYLGGDFSVEEIEAEHVRKVLARKQVLQEAATVLQMDRKTLLRRRKELKLE